MKTPTYDRRRRGVSRAKGEERRVGESMRGGGACQPQALVLEFGVEDKRVCAPVACLSTAVLLERAWGQGLPGGTRVRVEGTEEQQT
jgi:hypothetical protein